MRISDWSSDVCSSDLAPRAASAARDRRDRRRRATACPQRGGRRGHVPWRRQWCGAGKIAKQAFLERVKRNLRGNLDRKSVGEGKSGSVGVDRGGRRFIKKPQQQQT